MVELCVNDVDDCMLRLENCIKHRTYFCSTYIKPALEEGYMEMDMLIETDVEKNSLEDTMEIKPINLEDTQELSFDDLEDTKELELGELNE
jgi:hypothetical protein